ncbi:MAG: hypothetical protein MMC33_004170 [Icmadophila ericetorum]|nr:hypothetical protein [Icmadophila ericetorum]
MGKPVEIGIGRLVLILMGVIERIVGKPVDKGGKVILNVPIVGRLVLIEIVGNGGKVILKEEAVGNADGVMLKELIEGNPVEGIVGFRPVEEPRVGPIRGVEPSEKGGIPNGEADVVELIIGRGDTVITDVRTVVKLLEGGGVIVMIPPLITIVVGMISVSVTVFVELIPGRVMEIPLGAPGMLVTGPSVGNVKLIPGEEIEMPLGAPVGIREGGETGGRVGRVALGIIELEGSNVITVPLRVIVTGSISVSVIVFVKSNPVWVITVVKGTELRVGRVGNGTDMFENPGAERGIDAIVGAVGDTIVGAKEACVGRGGEEIVTVGKVRVGSVGKV